MLHKATAEIGIAHIARLALAHRTVVNHLALGIEATGSRTRITALLLYAGPVAGTVRVDSALGSADLRRIAVVTRQALADAPVVVGQADGVDAARTGTARQDPNRRRTWLYPRANAVGIALVAVGTVADGTVGHHTAEGGLAAAAGTGIEALVVATGLVRGTVGAAQALRPTEGRRAMELGQAGAPSTGRRGLALGIGAAG